MQEMVLEMELSTARDRINDCIRDGIPHESGYTLRLEMKEYTEVETATRFVWETGVLFGIKYAKRTDCKPYIIRAAASVPRH